MFQEPATFPFFQRSAAAEQIRSSGKAGSRKRKTKVHLRLSFPKDPKPCQGSIQFGVSGNGKQCGSHCFKFRRNPSSPSPTHPKLRLKIMSAGFLGSHLCSAVDGVSVQGWLQTGPPLRETNGLKGEQPTDEQAPLRASDKYSAHCHATHSWKPLLDRIFGVCATFKWQTRHTCRPRRTPNRSPSVRSPMKILALLASKG